MKKLDKNKSKHFPSLHLYREDLEEIIDIFRKVSERDQIVIKDDQYQFESIEELQSQHGHYISRLKLYIDSPYLSLEFNRRDPFPSIWLYRGSSDEKSVFAYNQIDEILSKRKSFLSAILNPYIGYGVPYFFFLFSTWMYEFTKNIFPSIFHLMAFLFLVPLSTYLVNTGKSFTIYLQKEHVQKNFFNKHKYDFIKITFGSLLGALITYFIGKLG